MKNLLNLIIDAAKNDDMNRVIELAKKQQDNFCDNNCVWTDHHPDCVRAEPEWYHTKNIYGCDVFYHRYEERGYMSGKITPLYTTPPQRTWVGLTDEDVREVSYDFPPSIAEWYDRDFTRFIHTLEAKLKEKNT